MAIAPVLLQGPCCKVGRGEILQPNSEEVSWWALQDSNLRPLPCQPASRGWQHLVPSDTFRNHEGHTSAHHPADSHDLVGVRRGLAAFLLQEPAGALLSVREVAKLLGVSTPIVYRLCELGDLAHVHVNHAIRIAPEAVAGFLERQSTRKSAQKSRGAPVREPQK